MTDATPPAVPAPQPPMIACPRCRGGAFAGTGRVVCDRTDAPGCEGEVHRFAALVDVVPEGGFGRCARHPQKDGVAGCERCGAFVCEVCATRTGERLLCPPCFDLLHARGELGTTVASRFRVDWLAFVTLVAGSCVCGAFGVPLALGFAIWALRRRRREPWISLPLCVTTLVLAALPLVAVLVLLVVAVVQAGGS